MSDDGKTKSDNPDAPMKDPKVDVTVKPVIKDLPPRRDPARDGTERQNNANRDEAERLADAIKRQVKKVVKDHEGGGKKKQLDEVRKEADRAAGDKNPDHIKEVKVNVDGNESTHKPGEKK